MGVEFCRPHCSTLLSSPALLPDKIKE